ncbi:hypothetical protein FNU79_05135 [Deinococcus detaillensis]|uniref:DUF4402 domain-containing protein n=1 Tax=Deinococcus detaillensis TaxID=2592048 RepID=A0A553V487_9DEIO|nr:hypothetical protein [Deinococcus detaillensis]TSA87269.1 hypothetical protein FNU79_05135 [Deinococcus detaillensis]
MLKAFRPSALLAASLVLSLPLTSLAAAQTAAPAPAPVPAPAAPATPAPVTAPATTGPVRLSVPSNAASALGIEVSAVVSGRLLGCPKALKLSAGALCLYAASPAATLRPSIKAKLGSRAGEWKLSGKASSLAVNTGKTLALVLLAEISAKETLVVVDTPAATAATAPSTGRPAMPAGAVKGEPYLLGSDLKGLVNITSLGAGQFKLERSGQSALVVTAGKAAATLGGGAVTLPLAPASDGKNLILPFSALGALGCTSAPNGKVLTVSCGANSVGIKPIVF